MSPLWLHHETGKIIAKNGILCNSAEYPCECPSPDTCPCTFWPPGSWPCNGLLETYHVNLDVSVIPDTSYPFANPGFELRDISAEASAELSFFSKCEWRGGYDTGERRDYDTEEETWEPWEPVSTGGAWLRLTPSGWAVSGSSRPAAYKSTGVTPVGSYGPTIYNFDYETVTVTATVS